LLCVRGDKIIIKGDKFQGSSKDFQPKNSTKSKGLLMTPLRPNRKKDDFENGESIQINIDETMFVAN
jgi:hypothetical protein